MSAKNAARLAESLDLTIVQKGGPFGAPAAVGLMDGHPVAAAWTRIGGRNAVAFLVRFKKGSLRGGPVSLAAAVSGSNELPAALSRSKLSEAERKSIQVGEDSLRFDLHWSVRSPSPQTAAAVLRLLHAAVSKVADRVGAACESCRASSGELYCVDGVPTSICAACREREGEEGRRRAEAYAALPPNLLMGTLAGLGACLVMAGLWGGVAYLLERIFLSSAILIGFVVAWSVNKGMGKVNIYGRALAIGLTFASVLLGDYLFILLSAAREWGESVTLELAGAVAARFASIELSAGSSGWVSVFFGVIGAGLVLWYNRPPAHSRQMVPVTPAVS
jgi:hypothetical protein